jgi:hypothetical protein
MPGLNTSERENVAKLLEKIMELRGWPFHH